MRRRVAVLLGLLSATALVAFVATRHRHASPPQPDTSGIMVVSRVIDRTPDTPQDLVEYRVERPWGTFEVWFRTEVTYSDGLQRGQYGYATLRERGRSREVSLDIDKPVADQIIRQEIAADVELVVAAVRSADEARPPLKEFVDRAGILWRRVE